MNKKIKKDRINISYHIINYNYYNKIKEKLTMKIKITNHQHKQKINLKILKNRIYKVLKKSGCAKQTELSLVITDDFHIAELNKFYLNRHGPTNVLAFCMTEGKFARLTPELLGDVVVSIDTAWREAKNNFLDPKEYFLRLIIHGILHLIGHNHSKDKKQIYTMEEFTEYLLTASVNYK